MNLNEQEAHCVARLLQSAWFGKDELTGCNYCKFQCGDSRPLYYKIRERLQSETGVDVSFSAGSDLLEADFPYFKFLQNSNERIKDYFRNRFKHV